ncbi:MAG: hypothetical protein GY714_18160 [Desulfobacterales bacterium]|nr:hypothetical protein [Desulfobacterales bacterium]
MREPLKQLGSTLDEDICAQCKASCDSDCSICSIGIKKEIDKLKKLEDRIVKLEELLK